MPLLLKTRPRATKRALSRASRSALALLGGWLGSACAPESYEREADDEVYDIVRDTEEGTFGDAPEFTIDRRQHTLRERLFGDLEDGAIRPSRATESIIVPKAEDRSGAADQVDQQPGNEEPPPPPGRDGARDEGARDDGARGDGSPARDPLASLGKPEAPAVLAAEGPAARAVEDPQAELPNEAGVVELDLHSTLQIAFENSRDYQTQKENVYVAALNLTRQRFNFGMQWFDTGTGEVAGVEGDTGTATVANTFGVNKLFEFGGSVGLSLLNSVSRIIVENDEWSIGSAIGASFTTPLMRGFGYGIAREPLTMAERDAVYAVRNFKRFQRVFVVNIASDFLDVLLQRRNLRNAVENLKTLRSNAERQRFELKAGRIDVIQLGQAAQDELTAEQRVVSASASLDRSLDQLKLTLGLPTTSTLAVLETDIEKLEETMATEFHADEELCIEIGRTQRQDLAVARGRLVDAERQVRITANALQMGLDLGLSTSLPTDDRQPFDFAFDQVRYSAGLAWDLPIQRLPERNNYRRALITREQVRRAWQQTRDQVDLEVRGALRTLEQARLSYGIQDSALDLATTRVNSAKMFQDAGRATQRDYLEAQRALLSAQDSLNSALIAYVIAQLELSRDLDILEVNAGDATFDAHLDRLVSP